MGHPAIEEGPLSAQKYMGTCLESGNGEGRAPTFKGCAQDTSAISDHIVKGDIKIMIEPLSIKVYLFSLRNSQADVSGSVEFELHGPPILFVKTSFDQVIYNQANFYQFEETSSYWSVKRISVFFCFSLVNQRHTSGITVHNRTVTNIANTVRAVHGCNGCFMYSLIFENISYRNELH